MSGATALRTPKSENLPNPQSAEQSVADRFAQIAARYAGRIAISDSNVEWTYAELDQRSNAVGVQIIERLGSASEPVALLMNHAAPLIAAILGALKAGKLYLALDPSHAPERLAAMLADSRARLVVTDKTHAALARSVSAALQVLEISDDFVVPPAHGVFPKISPDAGAWLMYTSGSTGQPKGVWQNHRGVIHHSEVYSEWIQLTPEDRVSLLASCNLSSSTTPLFAALLNGAALCPFNVRAQGVEQLAVWLRERRITVYHSVPTVFRHLARAAGNHRPFANLRLVRLGGEPVLPSDVEIFRQHCPDHCRLMHSLSSTETGLVSALLIDKHTALPAGRVSAGYPPRGIEVSLLDAQDRPVKPGEEGRIAVRSAYLRQGYWLRPGVTAEKFLPDPNDPRNLIFISNDRGRFLPDGSLEHLGRMDTMVKIRGLRVDLAEVEAALQATDLFEEAVAAAPEDESGERRLVAYVVPRAGADVSSQACRRALRESLREHAMPSEFVVLERLPQTHGGKIDRRALPAWRPRFVESEASGPRPRKGIEENLEIIWKSVLGVARAGRHDDFFDLGGDSLRSVQLLVQIEKTFGVVLPPSTLVEHGTIEQLAGLLASHAVFESHSPLILMRASETGRPLFLVHSGEGDIAVYGQLARRLSGRPVYGIQSIGLNGDGTPLISIPAMARSYLKEISAVQPSGPYLLGGSRMGAMVAFEMARQLAQRGQKAGLVAMLDFIPPQPQRFWTRPVSALTGVRDQLRVLRWTMIRRLRRNRKMQWLPDYRAFVAKMNCHSRHDYSPGFYNGTVTLFVTADRKPPDGEKRIEMSQIARDARTILISGERTGLFTRPVVDELAARMQTCLAEADGISFNHK